MDGVTHIAFEFERFITIAELKQGVDIFNKIYEPRSSVEQELRSHGNTIKFRDKLIIAEWKGYFV